MSLSKPVYQRETRRLATFNQYDGSKSILQLAKNGFYWSEDHKKIICYSCGFSVNDWNYSEDVVENHRQNSPECLVASGNDCNNIPMKTLTEDFEKLLLSCNNEMNPNKISYATDGPRDTTDCEAESQFVNTCRDILTRAKQKGIIGQTKPLPKIDLNNPDFELLKEERVRLHTFTVGIWPQTANAKPDELARNGMFYTGMSDRVQCAFCRGFLRNWAVGDVVSNEHKRHFPECSFVQGRDVGNIAVEEHHRDGDYIMTALRRSPSPQRSDVNFRATSGRRSPSPQAQQQTQPPMAGNDVDDSENVGITDAQRTFASLTAEYRVKHPQYTSRQARMQSFMNARGLLPRGQNIDTLVDAGFFHVGPHDNVKCFCCDVGLKNWQIEDNPWTEHARWFPRCSYLKEHKDAAFIQAAQANRNRWLQNNAADNNGMPLPSLNVEPSNMSLLENMSMPAGPDVIGNDIHGQAPEPDEMLGAPGARLRNQREVVAGMVYLDEPQARRANEQRRQRQGANMNDDVEDDNVVEIDPEAQQLLEENRQLLEVRTCKVCMDKEVNIVFLPCGHLVCCDTCAPVLRTCAVCRSLIRGTVKIFLA